MYCNISSWIVKKHSIFNKTICIHTRFELVLWNYITRRYNFYIEILIVNVYIGNKSLKH